jgi:TrmH family RNA methyltransferase
MITSAHNPRLKLVRALMGRAKERRTAGAFVAEGVRLVEDALAAGWPFRFALYSEALSERGKALVEALIAKGIDVESVPPELLQSVSETETPQGVLAVLSLDPRPAPAKPGFILVPDQVRDPGNLGTLLRTAAAAGVDEVLVPPETADPWAPKVVRAGMGAHFRLTVTGAGWDSIRARVDGLSVYLADMAGEQTCWQADFRGPLTLIVGGEADGASPEARALATAGIHIPMPGGMESLNAGVAGAILMFEVVRQRR